MNRDTDYHNRLEREVTILKRENNELRKTLIEQIIEADTMRKHYHTVEALLFEAQDDKERLDWILSEAGKYWLSSRKEIDLVMEEYKQ